MCVFLTRPSPLCGRKVLGLVSKLLGKAWKGLSKEEQRKWKTGEGEVPDVEIDPSWLEDTSSSQDQEEDAPCLSSSAFLTSSLNAEEGKDAAVCALAIQRDW